MKRGSSYAGETPAGSSEAAGDAGADEGFYRPIGRYCSPCAPVDLLNPCELWREMSASKQRAFTADLLGRFVEILR
jgi:hypothetical protein